MTARITAILLAVSLLLQVGSQAITLGWFMFDNQSFTATYCHNWEEEAPMCFGSCKVMVAFENAPPATDQFAPSTNVTEAPLYCQIAFGARTQDAGQVVEQALPRPVYISPFYSCRYVNTVFWPPVV